VQESAFARDTARRVTRLRDGASRFHDANQDLFNVQAFDDGGGAFEQ
jgi:hypothetical protein